MNRDDFDPSAAGDGGGIFGLPFSTDSAALVLIPVPFEATTSYLGGTSSAPKAIMQASQQVDLYVPDFPNVWKRGIALDDEFDTVLALNNEAKALIQESREANVEKVNILCERMNEWVRKRSAHYLEKGKIVGLIGGDHSTPFAHIEQTLKKYPKAGLLHIDAHYDLRKAYEGFTYSHASIMWNVMEKLSPKRIVQVGLRDFCEDEAIYAKKHEHIMSFTDTEIFSRKAHGISWHQIVSDIVEILPKEVYVSFDIDGLEPSFCPGTGTPVPGGLSFNEAKYLIRHITQSGRRIIGFDLNEVGPNEYDANVGARMLYYMCSAALVEV